ncbi:hypothetical protein DXG01_016254 [Tephrocybe rancida]|nr:hypothetical protein DXG01_016254 [Tephrocybe rancida]
MPGREEYYRKFFSRKRARSPDDDALAVGLARAANHHRRSLADRLEAGHLAERRVSWADETSMARRLLLPPRPPAPHHLTTRSMDRLDRIDFETRPHAFFPERAPAPNRPAASAALQRSAAAIQPAFARKMPVVSDPSNLAAFSDRPPSIIEHRRLVTNHIPTQPIASSSMSPPAPQVAHRVSAQSIMASDAQASKKPTAALSSASNSVAVATGSITKGNSNSQIKKESIIKHSLAEPTPVIDAKNDVPRPNISSALSNVVDVKIPGPSGARPAPQITSSAQPPAIALDVDIKRPDPPRALASKADQAAASLSSQTMKESPASPAVPTSSAGPAKDEKKTTPALQTPALPAARDTGLPISISKAASPVPRNPSLSPPADRIDVDPQPTKGPTDSGDQLVARPAPVDARPQAPRQAPAVPIPAAPLNTVDAAPDVEALPTLPLNELLSHHQRLTTQRLALQTRRDALRTRATQFAQEQNAFDEEKKKLLDAILNLEGDVEKEEAEISAMEVEDQRWEGAVRTSREAVGEVRKILGGV